MISINSKSDQLKYGFILGATGLGAIFFALLPTFSTWALLTLGLNLYLTFDQWQAIDEIPEPERIPLDFTTKIIFATSIFSAGLLFGYFSTAAQLILGVLSSAALGTFFVSECVIKGQQKLNQAYQNELDETRKNIYLARGAEPIDGIYEKTSFGSIFTELNQFTQEPFIQSLKNTYETLKILLRDRSIDHRRAFFDACENLFQATLLPLTAVFNRGLIYLQQQTYGDLEPHFNTDDAQDNVVYQDLPIREASPVIHSKPRTNHTAQNESEPSLVTSPKRSPSPF